MSAQQPQPNGDHEDAGDKNRLAAVIPLIIVTALAILAIVWLVSR